MQEIDLVKVMDGLKSMALHSKVKAKVPEACAFYRTSLFTVQMFGRMYEIGLFAMLKLVTRQFTKDAKLGISMLKKRKLRFIPSLAGFWASKRIFSRVRKAER